MICFLPFLRGPRRLRTIRALSLIELLVAVAILCILVALFFGVGSVSRKKAETAKCMGNLRSIGNAIFMYAAENNGELPLGFTGKYPNPPGTNWHEYLAPYLGLPEGSILGYNALFCPAKSSFGLEYSTYGANYPAVIALNPGQVGSPWMEPGVKRLNGSLDPRAFIIGDAQGGFVYTPTLWTITRDFDNDGINDSNHIPYGGLDFRHDGRANFFLVDGSIEQMTSAQWGKNENNIWGPERLTNP